ncbi:MAG: EAL domain-containing protein [Gammaproteobacteria bacterium]|nr:EAL domain-containing protein [Gammaproteobacteria bacterium]MBQ0840853.1 EAL domain-containing protein [Gammaproteobacteria bacterium]
MATSTVSPITQASSIELAGAAVDKQNHGLVALDIEGAILLWNDWMQGWTGIDCSQAIGKNFLNLFPQLHGGDYARAIAKVISSGQRLTWFLDREPELIDSVEMTLASGYRTLPLSRIAISPFALSSQSGCLLEFSEAPFNTLQAKATDTPAPAKTPCQQAANGPRVTADNTFAAALQTEAFGVLSTASDGLIKAINQGITRLTGYTSEQLVGQELSLLFPSLQGSDDIRLNLEQTSRRHPDRLCAAIDSTGKALPLKVSVFQNPLQSDTLTLICADWSRQQGNQDAVMAQRELLAAIYSEVADGIILLDTQGRVEHTNPVALEILGLRVGNAEGCSIDDLLVLTSGAEGPPLSPHREVLNRGSACQSPEQTFLHANGRPALQVVASATPLRDRENHLSGCLLILRITSQALRESVKLAWHVDHDPLTQLPNRHFLESELNRALETTQNTSQKHILLYLDLYNFSLVNDTCGKAAGDALLKQCALLFTRTTSDDTLVARIGNDEFAILLLDCPLDDGKAVANNIIAEIKRFSFPWGERRLKIGISIGGEVIDRESSSDIDVLVTAAFSCAAARESGRNRAFFQHQPEKLYERRQVVEWEPRITDALDHDGFCLHYQPIVPSRETGHRYRHYEALIRMVDSKGGLILPGKFIPTAELYGLIDDVDRWVIRRVIADLLSLDSRQRHELRISINLSGPTISDDSFMRYLLDIIDDSGIDPHHLQFEITETAAIRQFDRALELIKALKARGCRFSLDDFGTGLSSLGYLKQIPVDYLKIDGSFIRNMELNDVDFSMVSTINHLAHVMGIATIAECVENQIQLSMLQEIGIDCVQGFFIEKPKPLSAFTL